MKKRAQNKFYFIWSASIVLCIVLAVFCLSFSSCKGDGPQKEPSTPVEPADPTDPTEPADPAEPTEPEIDPQAPPTNGGDTPAPSEPADPAAGVELGETEDQGTAYIDRLTFLGDSTTYGLKAYGVLTDRTDTKQVWTPASGTLTLSNQSIATIVYPETGEEISIAAAAERAKPEYLVITLGVNGVSFMDEEYFKSEYTKLIESIQAASPDTKIICNSIYPVAASYTLLDSINNTKITAANGWIRDVAAATGTRFLNSASAITGADGWLPEEYQNGDGIHLNSTGFLKVLDYMRTHAYV